MLHLRTISKAAKEIKEFDSKSALSERALRKLINSGKIPHIKRGKSKMVAMEAIEDYINGKLEGKEGG